MNIIRNNTTVEYKIRMRQLAMRNEKDHTFINRSLFLDLYNPSRAGPAYLHPVYPDIIHFLNYPGILVFSGGAFPVYFSNSIRIVIGMSHVKQTSLRKNHCSIYKYRIGLYQSHIIYGRVQEMTQSV
jgi:hypothetical protein